MLKDDVLAVFDGATVLQLDSTHFAVRIDDVVISAALKDIDVFGYDEYLEEIRNLMRQRCALLTKVADSLNEIKQGVVTRLVIAEIEAAAHGTVKQSA